MEEFGTIDDEYRDSNKKSTIEQKNYEALLCEPGWFLSDEQQSNELSNTTKFKADYLYMGGKHKEAIQAYNTYISECKGMGVTVKRECLEGISRSCLAEQCYCCALKYALQFQNLSQSLDSHTVGLTLLFDCSLGLERFREAVAYGQKLVTLHNSNSDVWLKLSCAYAKLYRIALSFVCQSMDVGELNFNNENSLSIKYYLDCECTISSENNSLDINNERKTNNIANCLLHAEFHLKAVEGSAVGFALKRNLYFQEKIKKEMDAFNIDVKCFDPLREGIRKKYAVVKYVKDCVNEEFVDRGSSKFCNKEQVCLNFEELYGRDFEDKWFV